jgi:hypothetical protein
VITNQGFRGSWSERLNPVSCGAIQRASSTLAGVDVQVVALSVDDEASTADLIASTA